MNEFADLGTEGFPKVTQSADDLFEKICSESGKVFGSDLTDTIGSTQNDIHGLARKVLNLGGGSS